MHRMGSYFDHQKLSSPDQPHSVSSSKRSLLNLPPTPPPTSSIPRSSLSTASTMKSSQHSNLYLGTHPTVPVNDHRLKRHEEHDMRQIQALNRRLASLTIADMSPKLALNRVMRLYNEGENRETAAFVRRISQATFRQIVHDLPMETFLESMPHSMPVLEAVYAKIYNDNNTRAKGKMSTALKTNLSPENVVWQIVHFFACRGLAAGGTEANSNTAQGTICGPWVSSCKRLLAVLMSAEPHVQRRVSERNKALNKAIEGLGQHGPVGVGDNHEAALMNLPDALRMQMSVSHKRYSEALQKLEPFKPKNVLGKEHQPPVAQSHQRQLSLSAEQIQERLIRNKSLLNAVDPILDSQNLDILLGILQKRIDLDKEVLFQYTQLRRDFRKIFSSGTRSSSSVAPVLMKCQKGCQKVLDLMREVSEESQMVSSSALLASSAVNELVSYPREDYDCSENEEDVEDDSTVMMMSGISPFVPKTAKFNFLQRSVRAGRRHNLRTAISAENLSHQQHRQSRSCSPQTSNSSKVINIPRVANYKDNSNIFYVTTKNNSVTLQPSTTNHSSSTSNSRINNNSSSGVSSNNSVGSSSNNSLTTVSPPDSDCSSSSQHEDEHDRGQRGQPRSIVRVGADGTASVVINSMGLTQHEPDNLCHNHHLSSSVGNKCLRTRKAKKDVVGLLSGRTFLSERCIKCERPESNRFHGFRCTRDQASRADAAEVARLKAEVRRLSGDLDNANKTISELQSDTARFPGDTHSVSSVIYDVHTGDKRPASLVRKFGELYSIARLDTLDDLDSLVELKDAEELKSKLLFSVVVLSFRSAGNSVDRLRDQVRRLLQLDHHENSSNNTIAAKNVEGAINSYLRRTSDSFDLSKIIEEVTSQIWATLYDYPCLRKSRELNKYIEQCVRIAWGLANQVPKYVIEYDARVFDADLHARFHGSNPACSAIRTYLWPALREGHDGPCVHKAVVIT